MKIEIKNAIIESATLTSEDRGLLTSWIQLDYGGSCQGFGGYVLYLPKSFKNFTEKGDFAGHFIYRSMQIAEVSEWSKMEGKSIRVKIQDGFIAAIGHIVKDDWFNPSEDFAKMKNA